MTVAAILKHKGYDVVSIRPTASVADASRLLSSRRIGAVIVQDASEQLLGILSERDIIHALAANGPHAMDMTAGQLMTRALRTVSPRTSVEEAMTIMTAGRIRHLPVIERGVLIGLVSIGDVVKAKIMQQEHEVDSLRAYVAGAA